MWCCTCRCGARTRVQSRNLLSGKSKSCGCWRAHLAKDRPAATRQAYGEASRRRVFTRNRNEAIKRRRLEWAISEEDFYRLTSSDCTYCGSPPSLVYAPRSCYGPYIYNGLDRVDNTLGYTLANCVTCCKTCNYAKGRLDKDTWLEHCKRVAAYQSQLK